MYSIIFEFFLNGIDAAFLTIHKIPINIFKKQFPFFLVPYKYMYLTLFENVVLGVLMQHGS